MTLMAARRPEKEHTRSRYRAITAVTDTSQSSGNNSGNYIIIARISLLNNFIT
jgi:hypothetical protein